MSSETAPANAPPSTDATKTLSFNVEVFKIVKTSQQQHGLRHSDHQRYRAYCTRRIRRLRKTLNLLCGNMKRYQKKEIKAEEISDSKFLLIPLFQAERAWSLAMQLKQESNTEPRKKFHLIGRLRKAIKYTAEIEKLTMDPKFDARTKLEAQGYNAWMNGQFNFEIQKWEESLKYFNISKNIYEKLANALVGDEFETLYQQRAEEMTPNIRYCAYNIGDESAIKDLIDMKLKSTGSVLADNIDNLISQSKQKQIQTLSEVTWDSQIIQVKNEKVRLFLLNVQEYEKQIQSAEGVEAKSSIYENILKDSLDAIQILRDELKSNPQFKLVQRGQKLEEKPSNSIVLFTYLTYIRLSKTIERTLLMISNYKENLEKRDDDGKKLAKPQDMVRLYDIILQNYKEFANLIGVSENSLLISDSEVYLTFYSAQRAYYITLSFLATKKYKEAAGLCFKLDKYIQTIESDLKNLKPKSSIPKAELQKEIDLMKSELSKLKYKIQTGALLEDTSSSVDENTALKDKFSKVALVDRLDTYYEDPNLIKLNANIAKLPVDFEPVPCKPLFFDLALNHVELPSLEDKLEKKAQQPTGVKGFFKGIFGL